LWTMESRLTGSGWRLGAQKSSVLGSKMHLILCTQLAINHPFQGSGSMIKLHGKNEISARGKHYPGLQLLVDGLTNAFKA
jgi:hypothetical protein